MDVNDQRLLEKQGVVFLRNSIDRELKNSLSELIIHQVLSGSRLVLLLDCVGGDVVSTLHLYDLIRSSPIESVAIVFGQCTSATMLLLLACKKRLALRHARFRFHNMEYTKSTPIKESSRRHLGTVLNGQLEISRKYDRIVCSKGLSMKTLQKLKAEGEHSVQFDVTRAIKYGLIEEIIDDLSPYVQPNKVA